ncbi:MAG: MFS transporter [Rickettsiales bacterium]|nr:MFS transporter [Rickettsiales bacterium]
MSLFALPGFASEQAAPYWLGGLLAVTYLSYSTLSINYYAFGLSLAENEAQTASVSAWREGVIALGVLVASALPVLLAESLGEQQVYRFFSYAVCALCAVSLVVSLPSFESPFLAQPTLSSPFAALRQNPRLRWVYGLFFVNAIPPSVTATLFMFFVADVLHLPEQSGTFLGLYFLAAICSMPLWAFLSARAGKRRSLVASMALALASFTFAYSLGEGDFWPFLLICITSGMALGGDLTLLPALLADALGKDSQTPGLAFGIWHFISKFTLALAAGIALPALDSFGYVPESGGTIAALSISYAVLPCAFKLAALTILLISPIDKERPFP